MAAVLQIDQVSKVYRLGELSRKVFWRDWRRKLEGDLAEIGQEDPGLFWALRDVSFEVQEGEVLGLLGRNGAGKSTLLKVIAQITAPTRGAVRLRGRVASLLEVGSGFHQELTGRDNVFINGTILGMSRREVQAKFDEILAFAGVEQFIDTPVKRYSSGMRVRLAFAVAAHLEPEILLVDEVLAVGDVAFQRKCLGKIGEVARSGRTVLFVSHNNATIEALCSRAIVLESGAAVFDGAPKEAIEFTAAARAVSAQRLHDVTGRAGTGEVRVVGFAVVGGTGTVPRSGMPLTLELQFERRSPGAFPRLSAQLIFSTYLGVPLFGHSNYLNGTAFGPLPERGVFRFSMPRLAVAPGRYLVDVKLFAEMDRESGLVDHVETAADLHVEEGDFYGSGRLPHQRHGAGLIEGTWSLGAEGESAAGSSA